jgi:hypothetical protein
MRKLRIDYQRLIVDDEETRRRQPLLELENCSCDGCVNWRAAASTPQVESLRAFLELFGIDSRRSPEVYHLCQAGKSGEHFHQYGGWFHFVGEILGLDPIEEYDCLFCDPITVDAATGLKVWFHTNLAMVPEPLHDLVEQGRLVQLEFSLTLPWLIDAPEPD